MMLISLLLTAAVIYGVGSVLVRFLGWPTSTRGVARWLVALLGTSVLLVGLPDLMRAITIEAPALPTIPLAEVIPSLAAVGLAVLGYVAWVKAAATREDAARDDERTRHQPRERALPPAPTLPEAADGFAPLGGDDPDAEP